MDCDARPEAIPLEEAHRLRPSFSSVATDVLRFCPCSARRRLHMHTAQGPRQRRYYPYEAARGTSK